MKNKKAWIKIIEAFLAILLLMGVLVIFLENQNLNKKDNSLKIYEKENRDRKSTRLNSSHTDISRMPSSA